MELFRFLKDRHFIGQPRTSERFRGPVSVIKYPRAFYSRLMEALTHFPQECRLRQQTTPQVHCILHAGSDGASRGQTLAGSSVLVSPHAAYVVQEKRSRNSTLRLCRRHSEHRHAAPQRVGSSAVGPVYKGVKK